MKRLLGHRLMMLATGHGLHDLFTGIWVIVLASQRDALGLSYTAVGIVNAVYTLATAFVQPSAGSFFDRTGKPYLSLWAIATTAIAVFFAALAPTYIWLMIAGILAGTSSAVFHSAGLGNAKHLAGNLGYGTATATFLFLGNAGFAVGQPLAGYLLDNVGTGALIAPLAVCVLGAPLIVRLLYRVLAQPPNEPNRTTREVLQSSSREVWLPILAFIGLVFANQTFQGGLSTYLPQFYEDQGNSLAYAGNLSGLLFFFAAMGSFVGGVLSDYIPRRSLAMVSMMLLAPLTFLTLRAVGAPLVALSVILGLMTNISLPILLLIGQEVLPGGKTGAGGYAFGLTFLARGLMTPIVGALGDVLGLLSALTVVGVVPLIAALLFLFLPAQSSLNN